MQVYKWKARTRQGKLVTGVLRARNSREVAVFVQEKYGYVTGIKSEETSWWRRKIKWTTILSLEEKQRFFGQLGGLLASGINILRALDLLMLHGSKTMAKIAGIVHSDLETGLSFSLAIRKLPKHFSPLCVQLIEAGEYSGKLSFVLGELAEYYRRERKWRQLLLNAALYPAVVLLSGLCTLSYFLFAVLPVFLELYAALHLEPGQFIVCISSMVLLVRRHYLLVTMFLCSLWLGAYRARKNFISFLLGNSQCRKWYLLIWEGRACHLLAVLLAGGITLVQALKLVGKTLPLGELTELYSGIQEGVLRGMSFSKAISRYPGIFSPETNELIGLGEENGTLAEMLEEAGQILEKALLERFTQVKILLEPLLLVLLAVFVGGMIYFLLSPVYSLMTKLPDYD